MSRSWQLQDAKNRFSEVVDEAAHGPQVITRRGKNAAVVISFEQWSRLVESKGRLVDVLRRAPKVKGGLDVRRSRDTGRDTDLG